MSPKADSSLSETVLKHDYCIGCGACAYIQPDTYEINFTDAGMFKAFAKKGDSNTDQALAICPFSNGSENETTLSSDLFPEAKTSFNGIGRFIQAYAGYVREGAFREKGSSGGIGRWLLHELLEKGHVDYAIQIRPENGAYPLFSYHIYEKGNALLDGSTSAYYPVTLQRILDHIKDHPGSYVLTALPCFSKALRLLARQDPVLKKRITYVIGMVCGHLKSHAFAECLAWQLGVPPGELAGIKFRHKLTGRPANEKGVYAIRKDGTLSDHESSRSLLGGNWGHGMFKYNACDYCDDVVAETADVTIGDAWLDRYMHDDKGTNLILTRNPFFEELLNRAEKDQRLFLDTLSPTNAAASQTAGIRHKTEGLSYRLYLKQRQRQWAPKKRVAPENIRNRRRRKLYRLRLELTEASHRFFLEAKEKKTLSYFRNHMHPYLEPYHNVYLPAWMRLLKRLLINIGLFDTLKQVKSRLAARNKTT